MPRPLGTAILRAAVSAALHGEAQREPRPTATELHKHAEAHKLSGLTVQPVPAGHPKAPSPKQFRVEGSTLYVLDTDWPALQAALQRQRHR